MELSQEVLPLLRQESRKAVTETSEKSPPSHVAHDFGKSWRTLIIAYTVVAVIFLVGIVLKTEM